MTQLTSKPAMQTRPASLSMAKKVWNFIRHGLEMCAAMCIGLAVLDVAYVWAAGQLGYTNPFVRFPELSAVVVTFNMSAPMAAWMWFRGMDWRSIGEMTAAMVAEAILLLGAYWLGVLVNAEVNGTSTLFVWQHLLMMPAMLVPMLLRLDMYTGGMHHHAQVAA
jgi:hypothetical protein